jgi:DNA-directed RNA polymerase alpha subunit
MVSYDGVPIYSQRFNFNARTCDVLHSAGIRTMGDLRTKKKSELERIPGIGSASLYAIQKVMKDLYESDDPILISINMRLAKIEALLEKLV